MIDIKKLSYEALCFYIASNEKQIAQLRAANKELIEEMQRRIPYMLQKFQDKELTFELTEELTITKEGVENGR